jgi:hypothetical protein
VVSFRRFRTSKCVVRALVDLADEDFAHQHKTTTIHAGLARLSSMLSITTINDDRPAISLFNTSIYASANAKVNHKDTICWTRLVSTMSWSQLASRSDSRDTLKDVDLLNLYHQLDINGLIAPSVISFNALGILLERNLSRSLPRVFILIVLCDGILIIVGQCYD